MEFTLLFAAFFGVAAFWLMLRWEAARGNAADCAGDLWEIGLTAAVIGVFAGRLAAMLTDGVNPFTNPGDIVIVRAGVATGWASLAAVAAVAVLGRKSVLPVFHGLSAASLAGLAGWHAGCLARDSCLGTTTGLPWGIAQSAGGPTRHPVELYAAILFAIAAIGLATWKARSRPAPWAPPALALACSGAIRLATEPFRPSLGAGSSSWYVAAVVIGVGGLLWATRQERRSAAARP